MITDEQIRALQDRLYQDPLFGQSRVIARALSYCYVALHFRGQESQALAREWCWELYQSWYLKVT